MICYAVIDTNVLVSALLSTHNDAATVQIVRKLFTGEIIPLFNKDILDEYNEVLRRRKFGFSHLLVMNLLKTIEACGQMVITMPSGVVLPDMKDLPFYEVVLEKKDDGAYLVTGNTRHFPKEPFIVTANELLEILEANKERE